MSLRRAFMTVILVWWLLSPPGAPAAERIVRSIDEKGTIHISNASPVAQAKGSDNQAKAGKVTAPPQPVAPAPEAPPAEFKKPASTRTSPGSIGRPGRRPAEIGKGLLEIT